MEKGKIYRLPGRKVQKKKKIEENGRCKGEGKRRTTRFFRLTFQDKASFSLSPIKKYNKAVSRGQDVKPKRDGLFNKGRGPARAN
jgi:hypothetical protein